MQMDYFVPCLTEHTVILLFLYDQFVLNLRPKSHKNQNIPRCS